MPIRLLLLLAVLGDKLSTLGTCEAAAVRVPAYSLEGKAKDVQEEQLYLVELDENRDALVESEQAT